MKFTKSCKENVAFLKYNEIIFSSAVFALSKAAKFAKKNKKPYGILLTTTPNFLDSEEGSHCKNWMDSSVKFELEMLDWRKKELRRFIKENSTNDFIYSKFTWQELGYDKDWYEEQCRLVNNDLLKIKREIDLEWTYSSDVSPFTEEELTAVRNVLVKPVCFYYNFENRKFKVYMYEEMKPLTKYLLGVDVAGGLGQDSSTIVGINPKTGNPAFIIETRNLSVPKFAYFIGDIMTFWLFRSIVSIEKNNYGLTIIQMFLDQKNHPTLFTLKKRLFYVDKDMEREVLQGKRDQEHTITKTQNKKMNKRYGIDTSPQSREIFFDILGEEVRNSPENIRSELIFDQIKSLEVKTSGKIEHRSNAHDDILLGYLIAKYSKTQSTWRDFYRLGEEETDLYTKEKIKKVLDLNKVTANNAGLSEQTKIFIETAKRQGLTGEASKKKNNILDIMYGNNKK
jgi:hypothetical protein